ncbi:unnamed protein product [Diabrotica balteata]|uniref:Uncharacterized protein n=1 Tax=Diabrotica balteata TaxID=107213 RepID=A0A9N9TG54_DIABA|nr:unnamed protein product [Diabrotica balteata]
MFIKESNVSTEFPDKTSRYKYSSCAKRLVKNINKGYYDVSTMTTQIEGSSSVSKGTQTGETTPTVATQSHTEDLESDIDLDILELIGCPSLYELDSDIDDSKEEEEKDKEKEEEEDKEAEEEASTSLTPPPVKKQKKIEKIIK